MTKDELQDMDNLDDDLDEDLNSDIKDESDELDDDFSKDFMDDDEEKGRMDLISKLTTFDKDIQEMVSGWLGYEWDENKKKFMQSKYIKPICNQHCASWCTNLLRTYLRQTNALINPTEKDYHDIMEDSINLIWGTFGTEHRKFGLKSTSDMEKLGNQMLHSIRLMLTSTRHGGIKGLIRDTHQQKENLQDNTKTKTFGERAISFLNGFGGK